MKPLQLHHIAIGTPHAAVELLFLERHFIMSRSRRRASPPKKNNANIDQRIQTNERINGVDIKLYRFCNLGRHNDESGAAARKEITDAR